MDVEDFMDTLTVPPGTLNLKQLLSQAGEAIVSVDHDWRVVYCNDVYAKNVGLPRSDIIGKLVTDAQPAFARSIFFEAIEECHRSRVAMVKVGYSTILGRWLLVRVFPLDSGMVMLANDASPSAVRQHQLAQAAIKDLLTGLPNKLALVQETDASLDLGEKLDLIVIGLDRFKTVNDELGHAGGDMVLLEMASRMQSATRAGERLFRLNGDEFALLTSHDPERRGRAAEAMLAAATQPVELAGNLFVLGASAGGVTGGFDDADGETLLKRSSLALHEAKRRARGRLVLFDARMEHSAHRRSKLENELRRALDQDELVAYLQPQGSLATGELVGAEALVRWCHPTQGVISPAEFLPIARECGLMRAIDERVLGCAVDSLIKLRNEGIHVPISINLSVESIGAPQIVETIAKVLGAKGVSPEMLQIEVPEDALMKDVRASTQTLERLAAMGVRINVDDFGTGYSSFAYLAKFPVSALKIDRSFVRDMASGHAARKIVRGIARLAHSLNLEVIAEGAETSDEILALRTMQCDIVQGYGYGMPMPFQDFLVFARSRVRRATIQVQSI